MLLITICGSTHAAWQRGAHAPTTGGHANVMTETLNPLEAKILDVNQRLENATTLEEKLDIRNERRHLMKQRKAGWKKTKPYLKK